MDEQTYKILLIKASGTFLCDYITEDLLRGPEDELMEFLVGNAWKPFECWSGADIWELIETLANEFKEVYINAQVLNK